jgi:hypothetical protein
MWISFVFRNLELTSCFVYYIFVCCCVFECVFVGL